METMIRTGDEKHFARAKLRASSLACSPFFSAAQRPAACRPPTNRSRPSPENTWKRHGWVNLWLGAQWAASSSSSIHSRGTSVGRYSFTERRVLIAVSASASGRSVVVDMILPPDFVQIICIGNLNRLLNQPEKYRRTGELSNHGVSVARELAIWQSSQVRRAPYFMAK